MVKLCLAAMTLTPSAVEVIVMSESCQEYFYKFDLVLSVTSFHASKGTIKHFALIELAIRHPQLSTKSDRY